MLNIIYQLTSVKFLLLTLIRKFRVTQCHREQLFLHTVGMLTTSWVDRRLLTNNYFVDGFN